MFDNIVMVALSTLPWSPSLINATNIRVKTYDMNFGPQQLDPKKKIVATEFLKKDKTIKSNNSENFQSNAHLRRKS